MPTKPRPKAPDTVPDPAPEAPFWKTKTLAEMKADEWESLCDGCGRCCLHKLEDPDTGEISFTRVACRLLDTKSCRCSDYVNRKKRVHDCELLTPAKIAMFRWLPSTCAYRLLSEGKDLYPWHPLVSGDPDTVHKAGISVRGRAIAERKAGNIENHIVDWPK